MPRPKRQRVAPTDNWQQLRLLLEWPEQILYELIRPVVLFGCSAGERAKETGTAARTLHRKANRFDSHGMASLFADFREPKQQDRRMLPPPLRQLIVDRKTEYPTFTPHELATLCYVASGRRPSSHTVKRILATGPKPTSISRRYPRFHQFTDPAERRLAIIRLHAEGWTVGNQAQSTDMRPHSRTQPGSLWLRQAGKGPARTQTDAVSRNQDLTAYLMVLYAAIRQHGSPETLVSDGGGIFKAKEAMRIYAALGIRKEQVEKRQAWQSYIETHFNVQRRMGD